MAVVIVNAGTMDGAPPSARYLKAFDPDWIPEGTQPPYRMTGRAWWTDDLAEARRFTDMAAALAEWKRTSTRLPRRPGDGQPNRPLTAHIISFETVS